jgi:hypothetical protein
VVGQLLCEDEGCAAAYQRDHLSTVQSLENGFDICAIGIGKAESEHIQVVGIGVTSELVAESEEKNTHMSKRENGGGEISYLLT